MPSRSSHSTEAIVEAKRRWVASPWERSPLAGQGSGRSFSARRAPSAIPTGPSSALEA